MVTEIREGLKKPLGVTSTKLLMEDGWTGKLSRHRKEPFVLRTIYVASCLFPAKPVMEVARSGHCDVSEMAVLVW